MTCTMALAVNGCIIGWPREVGTVLGVRSKHGGIRIQNRWYSFTGSWCHHPNHWHSDAVIEEINPSPLINDISGRDSSGQPSGKALRYYVTTPTDIGKSITFYGTQYGNTPIQSRVTNPTTFQPDPSGAIQDGLTLYAGQRRVWYGFFGDVSEGQVVSVPFSQTNILNNVQPNLIPSGAAYDGSGNYNLNVSPGAPIQYTAGSINDNGFSDGGNPVFTISTVPNNPTAYDVVNGALTLQGLNGQPVTAKIQYGNPITEVTSIIRDATQGMAYLYEWDIATNTMVMLAAFQPNDTRPQFRRHIIRNFNSRFCQPSGNPSSTPPWVSFEALVKLACLPVVSPTDFLLVDDFAALTFAVQAIKAEDANDFATSETLIGKAIQELNMEDRDKLPNHQTSVSVNSLSHARHTVVNPI